ncbi:chromosome partitioning protein ParB [Fructilactobacillus lindneri]|uniref:Stage 0 sporulation protein J n=2 Tax=Fructilactobacillus lindneri TaxID=53444 RepID=A0A0R2K141_9LACO|nr:ParB/RepB/Spo0J family partition protein [Fructilactobacillus lindneri]ANZ57381.1 chromosome partitioning protein ParB [Fructilactobacillus lindneri]ANZ58646.1 chromosome partitioning protein ParB [Fructilactobacillus lindneri]KRN79988.1 Stage 0 sporulation protein J [Fructilactobacillus lindneri DSM 20690 = JCM 11027]POG97866.1 chromosome partitioning protein ParB [Fructilactobacillus lindneri]POG99198.1 chromosome partitioning protein ParB [Fructilactobacillus lindneri]
MTNKNSKGLGRGLDALFDDNDISLSDEAVQQLDLTKLTPNPYQPRKKFDKKALNDLTESVKASGVFQPIIVRQPDKKRDSFEILAGERRFRASKAAGRTSIPAIVRDATDAQMMEIAVMENLQREDLNPLEEAKAYEMLMTNLDITQVEVSRRLGKSRPYIANYLRLLNLPPQVKTMLQKGQLSMGQARTLLAVKNKADLLRLAQKAADETLTVRQLEKLINALGQNDKKKKKSVKTSKSPYLRESEVQLQEKLGTKASINETKPKSGKGKIEIDYFSNEDLNRILGLLDVHLD